MSLAETHLTREMVSDLDATPLGQLASVHTDYQVVTRYAEGHGYWTPGDGTPRVVFADPVEAQVAGRCVASRVRGMPTFLTAGSIHPGPCRWCKTPTPELLAACDHAAFVSRFVVTEHITWPTKDRPYVRSGERDGTYENPAWAAFFALTAEDRRDLVEAAWAPSEVRA
jgi:hypothetical protein